MHIILIINVIGTDGRYEPKEGENAAKAALSLKKDTKNFILKGKTCTFAS